jgi:hypothetical protein
MMVADSVEDRLQDEINAALLEARGLAAQLPDEVARFAAAVALATAGLRTHVNKPRGGLGPRKNARGRQSRWPTLRRRAD